jgi:SAM-dependent methyltransferase|tara:strand:- start:451 stop:1251 length:801 start_codon:yes stop_codon:yes gene_type:complete
MKNTDEHYKSGAYIAYLKSKISELAYCNNDEIIKKIFKYDQFHIGGVAATRKLLSLMGGGASGRVLDVGSGFGGVARYLAQSGGFDVVGLDLSRSYVAAAKFIDEWLCFADQVSHECGDICDPYFALGGFDWVVWSHVGMNIHDKSSALSNCSKALNKNGKIIIYDVLLSGGAAVEGAVYPLPWASEVKGSYLSDLNSYESSLLGAGFKVIYKENYNAILPKIIENDVPLDVPPFAGADFRECLVNLRQFLAQGIGAPWFIIAEKM